MSQSSEILKSLKLAMLDEVYDQVHADVLSRLVPLETVITRFRLMDVRIPASHAWTERSLGFLAVSPDKIYRLDPEILSDGDMTRQITEIEAHEVEGNSLYYDRVASKLHTVELMDGRWTKPVILMDSSVDSDIAAGVQAMYINGLILTEREQSRRMRDQ